MGFQLIDSENLLSKNQKLKIKTVLHKYDEIKHQNLDNYMRHNIIPHIHYENNEKKYNDFVIEKQNNELYIIKFLISHDNKNKQNLKRRLHMQKLIRQNSSDPKIKMWKQYYELSQKVKMTLPNPDMIQAQQEQYTQLLEKMPNSIIKKYIMSCLSE